MQGDDAFAGFPEDDLFGFEGDDLDGFDDFGDPGPAANPAASPTGRRISVDAPGFEDETDAPALHATPGFTGDDASPPRKASAYAGFNNDVVNDDAPVRSPRRQLPHSLVWPGIQARVGRWVCVCVGGGMERDAEK